MLTNSQGFKRFFELYFEPVYRFVRKYTEEDAIARDITQDTLRILHQAIDTLPPQTRKIILLGLNGKNNNEIAETLNISVNTVKSLKKSAYTSLREQLKDPMLFLLFLLIDS